MRKVLALVLTFVVALACLFGLVSPAKTSQAKTYEAPILMASIDSELKAFLQDGEEEKTRIARSAGSEGEKDAGAYVLSTLTAVSKIYPISSGNFVLGKQEFEFVANDGSTKTSQNVGVVVRTAQEKAKTVLICTSIDNSPVDVEVNLGDRKEKMQVYTEGINQSAGSVALLIALAKHFATSVIDLGFNLEFIFLGAGEENNAGAVALNRSINIHLENYALVVCLDKLVLGDNNYIFMQDFDCDYVKYINSTMLGHYNFTAFDKTTSLYVQDDGSFSHAGITGPASVFFGGQVNMLSVFSGLYNGATGLGQTESASHTDLTYTLFDNTKNIEENYGVSIKEKLGMVAAGLANLFYQPDFIEEVSKSNNLQSAYDFWYNEKYQLFAYGILMVLIFVVYYVIYDILTRKSQKRILEEEIGAVIMNIAEPGETLETENEKNDEKEKTPEKK